MIYLCRGKFVYKDVDRYRFYKSNTNSEIKMEGDDKHIFKIDNNRQVVAFDQSICYIYDEQNNMIPYPATNDTRHLSELFGKIEPAAKQLKKSPT